MDANSQRRKENPSNMAGIETVRQSTPLTTEVSGCSTDSIPQSALLFRGETVADEQERPSDDERPDLSDIEALRQRVRGDLWLVPLPLVVIGSFVFAYAANQFAPIGPLSSWIGLPIAFVIIWAVGRRRSGQTGIGGRDDELILAFAVLAAMPLASSPVVSLVGLGQNDSWVLTWPAIVMGLGLCALAYMRTSWTLAIWGGLLVISGIASILLWASSLNDVPIPTQVLNSIVALAMVIFGVVVAIRARSASE
jgi:hypothetical protein